MQIDKLVQLLESPIFVHLRLQMLDIESPHHAPLLKSCYGLLMLLKVMNMHRKLRGREQHFMTGEHLRDTMSRSCDVSAKWSGRIIAGAAAGTSAEGVVGAPSAPTRGRITQEV